MIIDDNDYACLKRYLKEAQDKVITSDPFDLSHTVLDLLHYIHLAQCCLPVDERDMRADLANANETIKKQFEAAADKFDEWLVSKVMPPSHKPGEVCSPNVDCDAVRCQNARANEPAPPTVEERLHECLQSLSNFARIQEQIIEEEKAAPPTSGVKPDWVEMSLGARVRMKERGIKFSDVEVHGAAPPSAPKADLSFVITKLHNMLSIMVHMNNNPLMKEECEERNVSSIISSYQAAIHILQDFQKNMSGK